KWVGQPTQHTPTPTDCHPTHQHTKKMGATAQPKTDKNHHHTKIIAAVTYSPTTTKLQYHQHDWPSLPGSERLTGRFPTPITTAQPTTPPHPTQQSGGSGPRTAQRTRTPQCKQPTTPPGSGPCHQQAHKKTLTHTPTHKG